VEAYKAGHALHTQLVSRLLADSSSWVITTEEETFAETRVLAAASAAD
jgi:UDP-3-O-acyl-N-acetylglucosamine deacetylase